MKYLNSYVDFVGESFESTPKVNAEDMKNINELVPKLIEVITGPEIAKDKYTKVGEFHFDGMPGKSGPWRASVRIWVGNDLPEAAAYYQTNDIHNPNDNHIVFQQKDLKDMYWMFVIWGYISGEHSVFAEYIKNFFIHEMIHAKDPDCNFDKINKSAPVTDPKAYYSSIHEFDAYSSAFLEAIERNVLLTLKEDKSSKKTLIKVLDNLSDFFSNYGKKQVRLLDETLDLFQGPAKRNFLQQIAKWGERFVRRTFNITLPKHMIDIFNGLNAVFHFNPKAHENFMSMFNQMVEDLKLKLEK